MQEMESESYTCFPDEKIQYTYSKHYTLFCNNINESLKKELNLSNDEITLNYNKPNKMQENISNWKPPSTYGLQNSDRIIPEHYLSQNPDFQDIDMWYELTKDIRNLKPLSKIQLNYIKTLPKDKILELLEIYNLCLKSIEQLLMRL